MPLKAERRILWSHAHPIVLHSDAIPARILEFHGDPGSSGIERILHKLLDHGGRPLHDLASGNLVGHMLGQPLDPGFGHGAHHGCGIRNSRAKSVVSTHSRPRQAAYNSTHRMATLLSIAR